MIARYWPGSAMVSSRRCSRTTGGIAAGCACGRADVVGDPTKDNLSLALIVLLGDRAGAEVRCALLPVVTQDRPDGLMFFTRLRSDDLARAAATSVFGTIRVNASAVCRCCLRSSGAPP